MSRFWKQGVAPVALAAALGLWRLSPLLAKPPGGGGGGGGTIIPNPAFVFLDDADGGLFLTTSDGSTKVRLTTNRTSRDLGATWSPDFDKVKPGHQGQIAFFRQPDTSKIWGDLYVVASDASGPPVRIRSFTDFNTPPPVSQRSISLSWSPDGSRIIYASQGRVWAVTVASGAAEPLFGVGGPGLDNPAFSPDLDSAKAGYQGQIAFTLFGNGADIALCPVEIDSQGVLTLGPVVNLTQSPDVIEEQPMWSGDGEYLAFSRRINGADITADGRGISVVHVATAFQWDVVDTYHSQIRATWSPDSLFIGYSDGRAVGSKYTADVFFVSPWDNAPPVNVTKTDSSRAVEYYPEWNPAWENDLP